MPDEQSERPPPSVDPTVLTTAQLFREIDRLREFVLSEVAQRGGLTDEKIIGVKDTFTFIEQRFSDLEARTAEQKSDTKDAVTAALQAAKEAVGQQTEASERSIAKSEAATTKQIDSVTALLLTSNAATSDTISDLKSRMDRIEAARLNGVEARTLGRDDRSVNFQGAGVVIAALSALIAIGAVIAVAFKP